MRYRERVRDRCAENVCAAAESLSGFSDQVVGVKFKGLGSRVYFSGVGAGFMCCLPHTMTYLMVKHS